MSETKTVEKTPEELLNEEFSQDALNKIIENVGRYIKVCQDSGNYKTRRTWKMSDEEIKTLMREKTGILFVNMCELHAARKILKKHGLAKEFVDLAKQFIDGLPGGKS